MRWNKINYKINHIIIDLSCDFNLENYNIKVINDLLIKKSLNQSFKIEKIFYYNHGAIFLYNNSFSLKYIIELFKYINIKNYAIKLKKIRINCWINIYFKISKV